MHIVYDIDQTVRNLGSAIRKRFKIPNSLKGTWWTLYKDKTIYDWVKEDYSVLENAPPTKYLDVIRECNNGNIIEFWSYQPEDWKKPTNIWLRKYFKNFVIKFLTPNEKLKELKKHIDTILVDDFPFHSNYERIILLDYPYNRECKANIRVKSKEHLKNLLESYNEYIIKARINN